MDLRLILVFSVSLLGPTLTEAADLPAGLKACKDDDKLNECVIQQFNVFIKKHPKGDPKFKIPPFAPLIIDQIAIKQSGNRNVAYVNLLLKNCKVYGLDKVQFTKSVIDTKKKKIHWEFLAKSSVVIADYELDGKFLLVPIVGKGKANMTSVDDPFTIDFSYTLEKRKGVEYIKFSKPKSTHKPRNGSVVLDNLFNGDKTLGDTVNKMLNENISELLDQFAPAIGEAIVSVLYNILDNISKILPYNQIFSK